MQTLSRVAPHGGVLVSPLPNQRIKVMKPYSNFIRFSSSPGKISSSLRVFLLAFGLFIWVLEQVHNINSWNFIDVNDLIETEVDGKGIFGFVEKKGWSGLTIKTKNGDRVFFSKVNSNGMITKFDHQMKNGEYINWRFTTELKIEIDQVERIKKEVYKIFEEDKDLEQEDAFAVVLRYDFVDRTAVLLVSCFTKTATHEDYFTVRVVSTRYGPKLSHSWSLCDTKLIK
ncbi:hypothetical protein MKW94_021276 [Papaver nudicaule]|uniref:Uncharacterized protein n=1 Tax=Papaver nudicaule TaxID=74823 RepID=A0AA41W0P2_PAPNU|nr:hypothetical protein [Papaver nudicaule]